MKRFLYLYFSKYQRVRKFLGGKWAKDRRPEYEWVGWDYGDIDLSGTSWPLNEKEYECESWP